MRKHPNSILLKRAFPLVIFLKICPTWVEMTWKQWSCHGAQDKFHSAWHADFEHKRECKRYWDASQRNTISSSQFLLFNVFLHRHSLYFSLFCLLGSLPLFLGHCCVWHLERWSVPEAGIYPSKMTSRNLQTNYVLGSVEFYELTPAIKICAIRFHKSNPLATNGNIYISKPFRRWDRIASIYSFACYWENFSIQNMIIKPEVTCTFSHELSSQDREVLGPPLRPQLMGFKLCL